MSGRDDTTAGAWFVAPRIGERRPSGPGSVSSCRVCGEQVWVEADDADLAQSCAAIACTHCTETVDGIVFIPPPSLLPRNRGGAHERAEPPASAPPPRCSGCGEPIEARQPAWIELEDGSVRPSSLVNFDRDARRDAWRLWHADCFAQTQLRDAP